MKSLWEDVQIKKYDKLNRDIECEVLVIGGGITGVLTAFYLSKEGKKVVLVERDRLCSKKTNKTTAVITAFQDFYYKDFDSNTANSYLRANLNAIEEYKKLSNLYSFDFEMCSSFKYGDYDVLKEEFAVLRQMNYFCLFHEYLEDFKAPALEFKNQAQMHPLKLINCLIEKLIIYENTPVFRIKNNKAYTDKYIIKADNIVVTTGYPFLKIKGLFPLKLHQEKSYVLAIKNDYLRKFNAIGTNINDLYFRSYGDYILIGGTQIRTGEEIDGFKKIEEFVRKEFNKDVEYKWINQDAISLDSLPYIGKYSLFSNNLFVATGFNLWGMTSAMNSALLIRDLIMKRENIYRQLFSPQRGYKLLPLLKNIKESIKGLISFKTPRCSHLGCKLKYIKEEDVYECPCHGTKYNKNGRIVDGPGIKDKNL